MAQKLILAEGALHDDLLKREPLRSLALDGYVIENVSGLMSGNNVPMCYVTMKSTTAPTVTTPTFSPSAATPFNDSVDVTISCSTEDAKVYYSTNGGSTFTEYEEAITLTSTKTIIVVALLDGGFAYASATYTKAEAADTTTP